MTPATPLTPALPTRLAILVAAVALLPGCAPDPVPTPTPTAAFASEEDAFAAAEATYRAYADASNSTDLHDPQTFESVYAWLRGDALAAARENYSQFYASGMTRTGDTLFDSFTPISYENSTVTARLCLDVSGVGLVDAEGISVVPDERAPRQALEVQFTNAQTSSSLAISSTIATSEIEC